MDETQGSPSLCPFRLTDWDYEPQSDPLSTSLSEGPSFDLHAPLFSSPSVPVDFPSSDQIWTDEVVSSGYLQITSFPTIEQDSLADEHISSAELQSYTQHPTGGIISPEQLQLHPAYMQTGNYLTEALNMPQWLDLLDSGIQGAQSPTVAIEEPLLSLIPINGQQHSSPMEMPVLAASTEVGPIVLPDKGPDRDEGGLLPGIFCFQVNSDSPTIRQRARYSEKRRKEIKEIRSIGACLRCKHLKKPVCHPLKSIILIKSNMILQCSKGTPCERCLQMVQSRRRSASLFPWMDCLRTSLIDVSIFRSRE